MLNPCPFFSCDVLPSSRVFCLSDCSEFYIHGPLQEPLVLVRPCGGPRRVREESSSERSLMWSTTDLLSLCGASSIDVMPCHSCVMKSGLFMSYGRTFLWRHTSRPNHLNRQPTVDWIQKQQQLAGKRFLSCLRRYNFNNVWMWICSSQMLHSQLFHRFYNFILDV